MAAFKNCFYKDASFRAPHLDQTDFESSVIPATDHHFTIRNTRQKMYLNAKMYCHSFLELAPNYFMRLE